MFNIDAECVQTNNIYPSLSSVLCFAWCLKQQQQKRMSYVFNYHISSNPLSIKSINSA